MTLIFALMAVFALADRLVGAGWHRAWVLPLGAALGGLLAWRLTGTLPLIGLGAGWAIYRSVSFFDGSMAPQTGEQRLAAVVRHMPVIVLSALAWRDHAPSPELALCLALYVLVAIGLACAYGALVASRRARGRGLPFDVGALVELTRGAAFGAAIGLYAVLA